MQLIFWFTFSLIDKKALKDVHSQLNLIIIFQTSDLLSLFLFPRNLVPLFWKKINTPCLEEVPLKRNKDVADLYNQNSERLKYGTQVLLLYLVCDMFSGYRSVMKD